MSAADSITRGWLPLAQAVAIAPLAEQPLRVAWSVAGIALGVALGVAVHLVNYSALQELTRAVNTLAGEVDLIVRGPRIGFDENLYPRIARLPAVEEISPALELDVALAGRSETLKILGVDPFRAARIQPALVAAFADIPQERFDADSILLSHAAAAAYRVRPGAVLPVQAGSAVLSLKVAGLLPPDAYRQRLGLMDIAAAQWRLGRLGVLNRIDLRLRPGTDRTGFLNELRPLLPAGVQIVTPEIELQRGGGISRAYRINLDMLALIALFTGAFLVYATQFLATQRRRTQFALLRTLGMTRQALATLLALEGVVIGAIGAACGVALGIAIAAFGVHYLGGDLGAGYFRTLETQLAIDPAAVALFFALGVTAAVAGVLLPTLEAVRRPPAAALRAGDEEAELKPRRTLPGVLLLALGTLATQLPPLDEVPVFGYTAIVLMLFGAMLLLPRLAGAALDRIPLPARAPMQVSLAQLKATPRQVAVSTAAIVISFSLMVSMLIMVASFRGSLDAWLTRVLPADLYLRPATGGETGFFTREEQAAIASLPGIARIHLIRSLNVLLAPERVPVSLLAAPMSWYQAERTLPMVGATLKPREGEPPPVWVSEVVADLYGFRIGDRVRLPVGAKSIPFTVTGVWRDYVRQNGAIMIERELYTQLTGDELVTDAAVWLAPGATVESFAADLHQRLPQATSAEISSAGQIRAASLRIFDRTFAVTYALEAVAIIVGLFGISASFGAQVLGRRAEFGMLRHVGMTRRQVAGMLGVEGATVGAIGVACGLALGWVIGLVLIHVVNRQSFHWSMDLHVPWAALGALGALLVAAAAATAAWSGRSAMETDVVRAVREDW